MKADESGRTGFFITGTGTGVGKTLVSALMTLAFDGDYWKPLQTGLAGDVGDTADVAALTGLPPERCHAPLYEFDAPLSPWSAARRGGGHVDLTRISLPATTRPLVIEGAGGLMVPLNARQLMIDLVAICHLPVILVVATGLGSINHALLSLEALRRRKLPIAGIVMNGAPHADDAELILHFGGALPCAAIPHLPDLTEETLRTQAARLREIFSARQDTETTRP